MTTRQRHGSDGRTDPGGPVRQAAALVAFLVAAGAAGLIGNLLQGDDVGGRYLALDLPPWAPPSWVFGVVWPVLYVMIGVAGWWLWRRAGAVSAARLPLGLWCAQLAVNAAWPGVFFGLEAFWAAVPVIATLLMLVIATMLSFERRAPLAAVLMIPYLLWIAYATSLNIAIAVAN